MDYCIVVGSFHCARCGRKANDRLVCCPTCFEFGQYRSEKPINRNKGAPKPISLGQLLSGGSEFLPLTGFSRTIFGSLGQRFRAMFYGLPGSGKSTAVLRICDEMATSEKPICFWAIEEGVSLTMRAKVDRLNLSNRAIQWSVAQSADEIRQNLKAILPSIWVVDSVCAAPCSFEELTVIESEFDLNSIFICQATKAGSARGSSQIAHWVDVVVECRDGQFSVSKNRFSENFKGVIPMK